MNTRGHGGGLMILIALLLAGLVSRSATEIPIPKQGAALLKTDILCVFAHPDDETGMAATLAFYARGRTSVVANVYCTRGEGGGNMVGTQSGAALGILREAELRDGLAVLGVRYCYFLDQLDWAYTESLSATLDKWGKQETLERLVRLVRVLRPEIMITMNPAPTPGQHGHHQAAGVLATEAFTAAADPGRFPLQLSKEGLTAWQPRRLFYGGGSGGDVTTIRVDEPLSDGRTPAQVAAEALAHHRSQAFGNIGNAPWLQRPQHFTPVKAMVSTRGTDTDLLAGLPATKGELAPVTFGKLQEERELRLEFVPRPAFDHYRRWVAEQGIEPVAIAFRANLPLVAGETNVVQLQIINSGPAVAAGLLIFHVPDGWETKPDQIHATVPASGSITVDAIVTPPAGLPSDGELSAKFIENERKTEVAATGHPVPHARVTRISARPRMDATGAGWEDVPLLAITPRQIVQGKVDGEADSSARVRLAHDGATLFVDVEVQDETVVSNIAPNDIKGHWRSDSVEICLDPEPGSEHTMGCFKLGIFPFDSTGVVRAARDADARQGPMEETAPGTRLASRRTAEGYRIQAAIPFAEIGLRPDKARLGFNLIVYDGDKLDAAPGENINESRIAWAPSPGVQGRPEDWGRIDLD